MEDELFFFFNLAVHVVQSSYLSGSDEFLGYIETVAARHISQGYHLARSLQIWVIVNRKSDTDCVGFHVRAWNLNRKSDVLIRDHYSRCNIILLDNNNKMHAACILNGIIIPNNKIIELVRI